MKRVSNSTAVVLEPPTPARSAVIWLHGLGADGDDFVPIVAALGLADDAAIRFIFPHARVQPVTLNGGLPMRSWFDLLSLDRRGVQDVAGIRRAELRIRGLVSEQIEAGIPSKRIVIAGFSQGGALALHTALRYPKPLAGLMALSTYLPMESTLQNEGDPANRGLPILMHHGRYDPVLPFTLGAASRDALIALGYTLRWSEFPTQHEVSEEQIHVIAAYLKERLA